MNTAEAATFLECSERHVRRLITAGSLMAVSCASGWYLDQPTVEQYRQQTRRVDDACLAYLHTLWENPPSLEGGWLDEMVETIVNEKEDGCRKPSAPARSKATAPAASRTAATAPDQDDPTGGVSGAEAAAWERKLERQASEEREELKEQQIGRMWWLSKVAGRRCCSQCGRSYFPAAMVWTAQRGLLCPRCRTGS